jgi:hypothetical protein
MVASRYVRYSKRHRVGSGRVAGDRQETSVLSVELRGRLIMNNL